MSDQALTIIRNFKISPYFSMISNIDKLAFSISLCGTQDARRMYL